MQTLGCPPLPARPICSIKSNYQLLLTDYQPTSCWNPEVVLVAEQITTRRVVSTSTPMAPASVDRRALTRLNINRVNNLAQLCHTMPNTGTKKNVEGRWWRKFLATKTGIVEPYWPGLFYKVRSASIAHHCIAVFISHLISQIVCCVYILDNLRSFHKNKCWCTLWL